MVAGETASADGGAPPRIPHVAPAEAHAAEGQGAGVTTETGLDEAHRRHERARHACGDGGIPNDRHHGGVGVKARIDVVEGLGQRHGTAGRGMTTR